MRKHGKNLRVVSTSSQPPSTGARTGNAHVARAAIAAAALSVLSLPILVGSSSSVAGASSCVSRPQPGTWAGQWSSTPNPSERGVWSGVFRFTHKKAPFAVSGPLTITFTSPTPGSFTSGATGSISCSGGWSVSASITGETFSGSVNASGTAASGTWNLTSNPDNGPWSGAIQPEVFTVSPTTGSSAGGKTVRIKGSGFVNPTAVTFGGRPAMILGTNSKFTRISVKAPAGTGTVQITVTTPNGTSALTPGDQFTYK
jgi:hypothetical protein